MYLLFRGIVLDRGVQCLKVLGLKLRDHAVVVLDGVQVMVNTTLDFVVTFNLSVSGPCFPPRGDRFPQMKLGQRPGEHVDHRFWLFATHDWTCKIVLQPHPHVAQGVYHF